jgi:hypothetical protein
MRDVGLRPEIRSQVFDPRFHLRLGTDFDPHLRNITGHVQGDFNLPNFALSAGANIDRHGNISEATVAGAVRSGPLSAGVEATEKYNKFDSATARLLYQKPDFALSAGTLYNAQTRNVAGGVEAEWRPKKDLNFALSATRDTRGTSFVGVGMTYRW